MWRSGIMAHVNDAAPASVASQLWVAYRSVASLQLKVTPHTPRYLWAGSTASRTCSVKRRSLARVPFCRPRAVRWNLLPAMMAAITGETISNVVSIVFGHRYFLVC